VEVLGRLVAPVAAMQARCALMLLLLLLLLLLTRRQLHAVS
jgi:hypothetical protein